MPKTLIAVLLAALVCSASSTIIAQTSSFSYQGFFSQNNVPANGNFDMQFAVYDDPVAGTQQGTTLTIPVVPISNGVFNTTLDFGAGVFSGPPRFLEIAVRPAGSQGAYTVLSPRTQFLSAPFAMKSYSSDTAVSATMATTATTAGSASTATTAGNASQLGGIPASGYMRTTNTPQPGNLHFTGTILLAPSGSVAAGPKVGPTPPAILYAVNPNPGSTDPSPSNIPQAAVRGDATSTVNTNIGVIGVANGEAGVGVIGLSSGVNSTAVIGINTATTGEANGITAETFSPDGNALDIHMPTGGSGFLLMATSGTAPNKVGRFSVRPNGLVDINGSINLQGNQQINGNLSVTGGTGSISANSLFISGTKNNVVTLKDGSKVLFYANESPEYWFEDFGTVKLKRGRAVVHIDPTFAEATNTGIDYKVFLTPNGRSRGLYVIRKTATTFEVRENGGGRSNITFDFRIVAKRRGYEDLRY